MIEPVDTRKTKTNFTLDNEETLATVKLEPHSELLEVFKIIAFVTFKLLPQVFLSRDTFKVHQDYQSYLFMKQFARESNQTQKPVKDNKSLSTVNLDKS